MAQAKSGDSVKIHYTGKLDDGSVFDSSQDKDPLQFTLGSSQVIPGFEQAVDGMKVGDFKTVNIPADQAYGPHSEEMVQKVERDRFPENSQPQVGQQFQVGTDDGGTNILTIINVAEDSITLDGNHPLAGKDLTFDIQLVEILQ